MSLATIERTKARQLVEGTLASYLPETLKVVYAAFDGAWSVIARRYTDDASKEAARLKLASAILDVTARDSRDAELLQRIGLDLLAILDRDARHKTT